MMATTTHVREGVPASYPEVIWLSEAAAGLEQAFLWQRIERHCSFRWSERTVIFVVDGPGEWVSPLAPFTLTTTEAWGADYEWHPATLYPSPADGFELPYTGPFRFSGTVGAGPVPADVLEAFKRLAEYCATEAGGIPGASSYSVNIGQINESIRRSPAWMARALENSGAADLLRRYRRVS